MRCALLGSPGIGVPFRTPFAIVAGAASIVGAGATYVLPGPGVLLIRRPQDPLATPLTVNFATEATQADFVNAINAQIGSFITATPAGGEIRLTTNERGSIVEGTVIDAASTAGVLTALGLAAGPFGVPGPSSVPYTATPAGPWFGRPAVGRERYQHGITLLHGQKTILVMVDRCAPGNIFADLARFAPSP